MTHPTGEGSLYSAYWYRVGPLTPRLQPGTRIQRQILRGEEWFVFTHPISGQHYRLNRKAYELIGRFNGEYTLDALWTGLQRTLGDDAPTQDEVIAVLAQLLEIGLVLFDSLPDLSMLQQYQHAQRKRKRITGLNPFAFRLRLFNPESLLDKLSPLKSILMHRVTAWTWCVLVAWALARTALDWGEIHAYAKIHLLTPRCLFLAWAAYPAMKFLHELGHALVVRHWGGRVKEAGIGFFLLVPAPYVDASAATALGAKWRRAAVGFAGIAVELALAALALGVWSLTEDGLVRDLALVVMVIGGVSTVMFNGNPLLRYDGYYILCDLIELPNLASRSQNWWAQRARYLLGSGGGKPVHGSELFWLVFYAPSSWLYRLAISVVIVQWVVTKSILAGLIALLWLAFVLLLRPTWGWISGFSIAVQTGSQSWKRLAAVASAVVLAFGALFFVPVPDGAVAKGIVWLPEQSQVRTGSAGQVAAILARDGQHVIKGQALVSIDAPDLLAEKRGLLARIAAAETEQANGWQTSLQQGRNASDQISRLRADLAQLDELIAGLTLRAEVDGRFVLPHQDELLGRHVPKGALVAYVLAPDSATVRVAVSQDDIGRIGSEARAISVRLAETGNQLFAGRLVRMEPAATRTLPSKAIGDRGGGSLITDPADPEGVTALEPVFLVDVQVPEYSLMHAGSRAAVRFSYDAKPLVEVVVWRFRQLFLRIFSMAAQ
ncbi:biotin/lipoyl-binding protein [Herbaspirillum sp. ST 5-3]|uniref:efflux RND transporter periplasmic adaptor subunit n=1 Tax=Oxalobacteraceae TaxID=75682 RepID=UPI001456072B|nr:biotin/lipoyl-binding protein [Herbaspirillum sp. ST 5-3]